MDSKQLVNIDFKKAAITFREYVLSKAKDAGSTIVYALNGQLVEEDPKNDKITILKEVI